MSPPPRLVVVEHDDWILRLLADGLREGGFVVATASSADEGLARVHEFSPDAILCDVALPGTDGYAFATSIRAESIVPIALLAAQDDTGARTAAFEAGADALLVRPFRLEEVAAQMTALVQLARRMRARRTSLVDSLAAGPPSTTFKGDLAHMPVSSLLMLLEIEKKSGTIEVKSNNQKAIFELASGWLVSTRLGGENNPAVVLREVLGWTSGRISFNASAPVAKPASARAVRVLLAEAGYAPTAEVAQSPVPQSPSVARMPAMRPPPGRRISANEASIVPAKKSMPSMPAVAEPIREHRETVKEGTPAAVKPPIKPVIKETIKETPKKKAPALEEQQATRKVDVPEVRSESVRPPAPAPTESPPTTRRPR